MRPSISAVVAAQNPSVVRSPASAEGVSRWIASTGYNISTTQGRVFLNPFEPDFVSSCFASDSLRLSFAGRETLQTVRAIRDANATHAAWSAIQLYYAAFYYTSATIRLLGVSNSFLYHHELRNLRALAAAQSINQIPASGLFNLELSTTAKQLEIESAGGAGSHEALWAAFRRQIDAIKQMIPSNPVFSSRDILQAMADLEELEKASKGIGASSNLSSVRNDIQYRQKLECWHPNLRNVKNFHKTDRIGQIFKTEFDPTNILHASRDYDDFFTKCLLITSFCHNFILALSDTASKGSVAEKYCRYHNTKALA